MWGIPLLLCFGGVAALAAATEAVGAGEYFNGVALAGVFVLCCWGVYTIFKRRARDRFRRW